MTLTAIFIKGSNLLLHLERIVGGLDVFLPYMHDYVKTFRGKSISTQDWQSHLFAYFGKQKNGQELTEKLNKVNWDAWLRGTGLDLPVDMEYDTTLADAAYSLAAKWDEARRKGEMDFRSSDLDKFTSSQTGTSLATNLYTGLMVIWLIRIISCFP